MRLYEVRMRLSLGGLWRRSDFLRLWVSGTASAFGAQIRFLALPLTAILVLDATPLQLGILATVGSAPALILGLGVGVWVDRRRKRPVMVTSALVRAVLILAIPVAAALQVLRIEHLYVVAFGVGVLNLFYSVANRSLLPSLVDRDELVEANSKLEVGLSASLVAGPGTAGALTRLFTAPAALIADAVTSVVSALAIWTIRAPEPQPETSQRRGNLIDEARQGLSLIGGNSVLLAIAGVAGGLAIFNAMFEIGWFLYITKRLEVDPLSLTLMISISSIGSLVGASVAERVIRWAGTGRTIVVGVVMAGLSDLATPLIGGPFTGVVIVLTSAMFFFGIGVAIYSVSQVTLRQAITPLRLQGRMNGFMNALQVGLVPVGALIGGILGETIGIRPTMFLSAGGEIAAVVWLLVTPVWSLSGLPEPTDD